jgi:hypothetical protein
VDAIDGATTARSADQSANGFGHAESRLQKTHAGSSLALSSAAQGGEDALAVGDGTNTGGNAAVEVNAESLIEGDAQSEARASSPIGSALAAARSTAGLGDAFG